MTFKLKKKSLKQSILAKDMFGYPVHQAFNIAKDYHEQRTFCGGCFTILIWIIMAIFIIYKLTLLFGTNKDFIRSDEVSLEQNVGSINLEQVFHHNQGVMMFI